MKYVICCWIFFLLLSLTGCTTTTETYSNQKNELRQYNEFRQFAEAHCLYLYLKKMNYDTRDIEAILQQIIESGISAPTEYLEIKSIVEAYQLNFPSTKNNTDTDLLKCFHINSDYTFLDKLQNIVNKNPYTPDAM